MQRLTFPFPCCCWDFSRVSSVLTCDRNGINVTASRLRDGWIPEKLPWKWSNRCYSKDDSRHTAKKEIGPLARNCLGLTPSGQELTVTPSLRSSHRLTLDPQLVMSAFLLVDHEEEGINNRRKVFLSYNTLFLVAAVTLGHKTLRTLMKRSSLW